MGRGVSAIAGSDDTIALMLQSTLAVDAIFFALFTLLGALLNETIATITDSKEREAALRTEYVARHQSRDLLDPQRQRATDALREVQRTMVIVRARARLLASALIIVTALIVASTFVLVYSFTLLDHHGVSHLLLIAFYVLMVAPLASAVVMVEIVRRLRTGR